MKVHHNRFGRKPRGMALVLVLSCLVLVSLMIVAFMTSMRTKLQLSKAGSDANNVRILSDTAANIVISQVRDATVKAGQERYAWASQPGMLRLYNNNGAVTEYYKLYSWDNMVSNGAFKPFDAAEKVPDAWAQNPAVYVDLNTPANNVFPILDYDGALTLGTKGLALGTTVPGATAATPAPMPVKWLYVLADGSVHPPDSDSTGTRAVISAASGTNPIVGRIAFWTDDETCKVNVNTASVGTSSTNINTSFPFGADDYNTFWDTPRFCTATEMNFSNFQPAQGEYQRYPGHPATVGLNTVFPNVATDQIFAMAPRYSDGGSKGGSVRYDLATWIDRTSLADRLYASIDELIFGLPDSLGTDRLAQAGLTKQTLNASKFFLTTSSRAPELNLFGQPRVSIWPIDSTYTNSTSQRVSTIDRLIAFCSTINKTNPFFFTRRNAKSCSEDISQPNNLRLLNYLDALTSQNIPGFGGRFSDKYSTRGTKQILTEIYDYVRITNLQDSLLPGYVGGKNFGGDNPNWFAPKLIDGYELGRAQVAPSLHPSWDTLGFGRIARPVEIAIQFIGLGQGAASSSGTVIPIPNEQIGYSEIEHEATITQVAEQWVPPHGERAIQAVLLINMLSPANAYLQNSYYQWIEITGLDSLEINGKKLGFPHTGVILFGANNQDMGSDRGGGYQPFYLSLSGDGGRKFSKSGKNAKRDYPFYSKIISVPVSGADSTMKFSGGGITVNLYDASSSPTLTDREPPTSALSKNKQFQSISIQFPTAEKLPVPGLTKTPLVGVDITNDILSTDSYGRVTNRDRYHLTIKAKDSKCMYANGTYFNGSAGRGMIDDIGINTNEGGDVIQSVVLAQPWSDARLLAQKTVFSAAFTSHPNYGTSRLAHSMLYGDGLAVVGHSGLYGQLVTGATYTNHPPVPPSLYGATDWDNGVSVSPDGPWINAPDAGNMRPAGVSAGDLFIPYVTNGVGVSVVGNTFFSPNRQVCSPGVFGSLSTGIAQVNPTPWRTLLFRPPENTSHLGYSSPHDHLLLDLFWMPIVEPYAISEPFSTAGKINLNQQLVPFTYINRNTSLRAALAAEKVAIMPKSNAGNYKNGVGSNLLVAVNAVSRLPIDLDETLKQVTDKFADGELYRSASEICNLYLVPQGYSLSNFKTQWYGSDFALVGDNVRERPYANLYGKLTTKSNTFTVHYWAQALQQTTVNVRSNPTVFDVSRHDRISAEQRGSTTFERYLDSADSRFGSGAPASFLSSPASSVNFNFENYYRTRILYSKIFNP